MVQHVRIPFDQTEIEALQKWARDEMRGVSFQARFIIRQELKRQGLLNETAGYSAENSTPALTMTSAPGAALEA